MILTWGGVAILVVLAVLAYYFLIELPKRNKHSPIALFRLLCREHQLTGQQRAALERLASAHQLSHPATLFLNSDLWEVVEDESRGSLNRRHLNILKKVRPMIFSNPPSLKRPSPQPAGAVPQKV